MKQICLLPAYLLLASQAYAQTEDFDVRDFSMASSAVALYSGSRISKNQAIIPSENHLLFSSNIISNYLIREVSPATVRLLFHPFASTSFIAGYGQMGNSSFVLRNFDAGIVQTIGPRTNVGLKFTMYNTNVTDNKNYSETLIAPELEFFTNPFKNFYFGAIIRNPVRFRGYAAENKSVPVLINPGMSFKLNEKSILCFSVLQTDNKQTSLQSGIDYNVLNKIFLRLGIQTRPLSQSFGFGYNLNRLGIDVGYRINPEISNSSAISLTFSL